MMRINRLATLLAALACGGLAVVPTAAAQATPPAAFDAVVASRAVIDALGAGKFAEVEAQFSPEMAQALPAGQLATAWGQVATQAGKLVALDEPKVEDRDGIRVLVFPATYEHLTLNLILAWTAGGKLAGLLAQPRA